MPEQPLIHEQRRTSPVAAWQASAQRRAEKKKNAGRFNDATDSSSKESNRARIERERQAEFDRNRQEQDAAKTREEEARRKRALAQPNQGRNASSTEARDRQKYENDRKLATESYDKNRNTARRNFDKKSADMSLEHDEYRNRVQAQNDANFMAANGGEDPWNAMSRQQGDDFNARLENAVAQQSDPVAGYRQAVENATLQDVQLGPIGINTGGDPRKRNSASMRYDQRGQQPGRGKLYEGEIVDPAKPPAQQEKAPEPKVIDGELAGDLTAEQIASMTPFQREMARLAKFSENEQFKRIGAVNRASVADAEVLTQDAQRLGNTGKQIEGIFRKENVQDKDAQSAVLASIDQAQAFNNPKLSREENALLAYNEMKLNHDALSIQQRDDVSMAERSAYQVKSKLGPEAYNALQSGSSDFSSSPLYAEAVQTRLHAVEPQTWDSPVKSKALEPMSKGSMGLELGRTLNEG